MEREDENSYLVMASRPGTNILVLTETDPMTPENASLLADFPDAIWRELRPGEAEFLGRVIPEIVR